MTTSTWHADRELLTAWVTGALDALPAASVEQHLARCADCREAVRPLIDRAALARGWDEVRLRVESPRRPLVVRLARRLGLPEPQSVLLAATASLRTAWVTSSLVAVAFAVVAASATGGLALAPFLLVAPLVPVVGVAAAYAPAEDPLESLLVTSPYGRTRLILERTLAILVTCIPFTMLLGLAVPGPAWLAAAWLGPALALVPVLLVVSSLVGPRLASALVAIGWSAVVLLPLRRLPATWPVEVQQQVVYAAVAAAACAVLFARSHRRHEIGALL